MSVKEQIEQARVVERTFNIDEFSKQDNAPGRQSVILEYQAKRPLMLREGSLQVAIPRHESFTTDGTSGNTETFNLSGDVPEDNIGRTRLVLFEEGSYVEPDSVSYSGDSFDYTDDGTSNSLDVFYLDRTPGTVEFRLASPGGNRKVTKTYEEQSLTLLHDHEQSKDPFRIEFSEFWPRYVPTDWYLRVLVDVPTGYNVTWEHSRANGDAEPLNAQFNLPVLQSEDEIPGLADQVKAAIGGGR